MILIKEIDGCQFCYFLIAQELATMLKTVILAQIRADPRKHLDGYIRWLEHCLAEQLDHADDDELEDDQGAA